MGLNLTIEDARETLASLYKAKKDIIEGQAASYRAGTREVVLLTLEAVNAEIRRYEGYIDVLTGTQRGTRVKTVVFVDG